jgi:Kef-type K+ transport system membrane component KefB
LLLQLLAILAVARACGWILGHFGQPPVIGEMAAGLLLGPIVFGALAPQAQAWLFPAASLPPLSALATLGLVMFMFVVGLELRAIEGTRTQLRAATRTGSLAFLLPLASGLAIAPSLYPHFAPPGLAFWPFALFLAAAVSATAFPVLARILKDRKLTQTSHGRLALGAAAIDDAVVWIFLAGVLAFGGARGGHGIALIAGGTLALVAIAFLVLKPLFARLLRHARGDAPTHAAFVAVVLGLIACSAFAEAIGLHAVFGAFVFGACLPRDDGLAAWFAKAFEPVSMLVLMPVVFALAGLGTTPDAFVGAGIGAFALVLLVAVAGKILGGALGARWSGYGWRDSFAVGSLVNARGLMELVVLKIGLDAGLVGRELFTMLFGMAIVTTMMTSPMLALCMPGAGAKLPARGNADSAG